MEFDEHVVVKSHSFISMSEPLTQRSDSIVDSVESDGDDSPVDEDFHDPEELFGPLLITLCTVAGLHIRAPDSTDTSYLRMFHAFAITGVQIAFSVSALLMMKQDPFTLRPVSPLIKILDSFYFAFSVTFFATWYFLWSGGLHQCLSILFDPHHYALLKEQRRQFKSNIIRVYIPIIVSISALTLFGTLYVNLAVINVPMSFLDYIAMILYFPYVHYCTLIAVSILPLIAHAHSLATSRQIEFFTDSHAQAAVLPELTREMADSGTLPEQSSDQSNIDWLQYSFEIIFRNRQHLARTSARMTLPLCAQTFSVVLIMVFFITALIGAIKNNSIESLSTYIVWCIFYLSYITFVIACAARMSTLHSNAMSQLRLSCVHHASLQRNAWQLQLLVSTPDDDKFSIGNSYPLTFSTVLALFSLSATIVTYLGGIMVNA